MNKNQPWVISSKRLWESRNCSNNRKIDLTTISLISWFSMVLPFLHRTWLLYHSHFSSIFHDISFCSLFSLTYTSTDHLEFLIWLTPSSWCVGTSVWESFSRREKLWRLILLMYICSVSGLCALCFTSFYCIVLSCLVSFLDLTCLVLSCLVLSDLVSSCLALPCDLFWCGAVWCAAGHTLLKRIKEFDFSLQIFFLSRNSYRLITH